MAFRDLLEQAIQQQMLENQIKADMAEQFTPSAGQFTNFAGMLAPGAGVADAAGQYPALPSYDQPVTEAFSQEPYPSMSENIANRNIFDASMQGLGVAGDALYGVPVLGAALGPTVGTALKGIGALGTVAKAAVKGKGIKALDKASKPSKKMSKADEIAARRAEANEARWGPNWADEADTSYRGQHQVTEPELGAARLDDMTGGGTVFPDDIYSPQGLRYYGNPNNKFDLESYEIIQKARGNPDMEITIYRAVPKGVKNINSGDFVTPSKAYAKQHAYSGYGSMGDESGDVISKKVKVKEIYSPGDDLNEFGYFPIKAETGKGITALKPTKMDAESISDITDWVDSSKESWTQKNLLKTVDDYDLKNVSKDYLQKSDLLDKDGNVTLYRYLNIAEGEKLKVEEGIKSLTTDLEHATKMAKERSSLPMQRLKEGETLTQAEKSGLSGALDTALSGKYETYNLERPGTVLEYKVPLEKIEGYLPAVWKNLDKESLDGYRTFVAENYWGNLIDDAMDQGLDYADALEEVAGGYAVDDQINNFVHTISDEAEALVDLTGIKPNKIK